MGGQFRFYPANKCGFTGLGRFGGEVGPDRALFTAPGNWPLRPPVPRPLGKLTGLIGSCAQHCTGRLALVAAVGPVA